MSCKCEGQLDSIMKFLEEMRTEIGFVKTKCIRIEKEILGITAESEMNPEALMETTTVRHLVEKMAYDVGLLTEESKNRASAEEKREKKLEAATKESHSKFSEASDEKINDLQLKYDIVAPKSFQVEFSDFLNEFRSETERSLSKRGFARGVIRDIVEEVTSATDSADLYERRFADKNKEMESFIREQYEGVVQTFAKKAIERKDSSETGKRVIEEFLSEFKMCKETFASFQEELLNAFQETNEEIEANRGLLDRLTEEYRQFLRHSSGDFWSRVKRTILENTLTREIIVSDRKLVPIFVEVLEQNMRDIANAVGKT